MAFGVTAAGWVPKPLATILAEIQADLQAVAGTGINLAGSSVFGQIANRMAQREASVWDLGQALWNAFDPSSASDAGLDNLGALTGVTRLPASKGTVAEVLIGTNATIVPQGTVVSAAGASKVATNAAATIATLAAWAPSTAYAVGDLKTNDTGKIYSVTAVPAGQTTGLSAGSGGPTGTGTAITDNQLTWRYVATGTAAVAAACTAQSTGPATAAAGSITTIETPVAGLASVVNPLDLVPGRDIETDAAMKVRREALLRQSGNAALDAVRADVLAVLGVSACNVLQNDTDIDNSGSGGQPPHSIECIVTGGTDAAVRAAILTSKAAGTRSYGTNTLGTIVDSQGNTQQIDFTRPSALNIWIIVNGTKDASKYPSDGDAQIKQALVNYSLGILLDAAGKQVFAGYGAGDIVNAWNLTIPVKTVSGVKNISSILIGTAPTPTLSADIATTIRQLASFDTSRITVALV
jgi:uncharacterized phage protein gp47/JayE